VLLQASLGTLAREMRHLVLSANHRRVAMTSSFKPQLGLGLALALVVTAVSAGPLDADCTPQKAAKHAAEKATVGVGNRCDPKETASDTAKKATNIDDKDLKNKKDNGKKDKNDKKDDKKSDDDNSGWSVSK
jgi:hypothetical protein